MMHSSAVEQFEHTDVPPCPSLGRGHRHSRTRPKCGRPGGEIRRREEEEEGEEEMEMKDSEERGVREEQKEHRWKKEGKGSEG